jgi:FAD:protein FMN transferase
MNPFRHTEAVMGTVVNFEIRPPDHHGDTTVAPAGRAVERAVEWLHWVDATFSTYRWDSEIKRLDRGELARADCAPEVREILALCEHLHSTTGGYFDASASGHLDPSGVVKGWSLERASALLADAGWRNHVVEGGGDVRVRGAAGSGSGWHVGITHPFRRGALCAVVGLDEGAVATSGTYERGLHVLDPHRGTPATALAAVSVIGPELVLTDAYATAALAMGEGAKGWLEGLAGYEALVIDALGRAWETPGFARHRLTGPTSQAVPGAVRDPSV